MANSVFTVEGLSFAYPARGGERPRAIFDGLDLTLREGVVTTLIGANGSGKSTLFNLLTKNLRPDTGSIRLRGGDASALRLRDFARLVAIVHQRNGAPADLPVRKLVEYGRFPHHGAARAALTDEDDRMVDWALETCGVSELAEAPVASLSGGQAQRVWIACALAQEQHIDRMVSFHDLIVEGLRLATFGAQIPVFPDLQYQIPVLGNLQCQIPVLAPRIRVFDAVNREERVFEQGKCGGPVR